MSGVVKQQVGGQSARHMCDSGVCSFGSEADSNLRGGVGCISFAGPMTDDPTFPLFSGSREMSFDAVYFGDATLDRRHTPAMLPWLMAGVRRRGNGQSVRLVVGDGNLSAFLTNDISALRDHQHSAAVFCHRLNTMTRFARTVHNAACFSYLTRPNSDSPFVCHIFQAKSEATVRIKKIMTTFVLYISSCIVGISAVGCFLI